MTNPQTGVSVIIPVYNEQDAIADTVCDVRQQLEASGHNFEILVVDDGSTDASSRILEGMSQCVVIRHRQNRGYGAALKTGLQRARMPLVAILDADGTYPIRCLPGMIAQAARADMVIGRRVTSVVDQLWLRALVKWVLTRLAVLMAGHPIPDLNSGMRVFRRGLALRYFDLFPDGFSFTTTITVAMLLEGRSVEWRRIRYSKRVGRSKIRPFRDTRQLLRAIVRTTYILAPSRVLIPLATSCSVLLGLGLVGNSINVPDPTDRALLMLANLIQLGFVFLVAELSRRTTARTNV